MNELTYLKLQLAYSLTHLPTGSQLSDVFSDRASLCSATQRSSECRYDPVLTKIANTNPVLTHF